MTLCAYGSLNQKLLSMKRLYFSFIISLFSLVVTASGTYQVTDSLELFEDITDISRLIQQRASEDKSMQDTIIPLELISPKDTIIPRERITDYIMPELIRNRDFVKQNPLDSIYFRNERGILQLPADYFNPDL